MKTQKTGAELILDIKVWARIKLPLLYIKVEESMAILFKRETLFRSVSLAVDKMLYLTTSACRTLFLVAIHNTVLILLKEIPVVVVRVKLKKLFILWRYAQ